MRRLLSAVGLAVLGASGAQAADLMIAPETAPMVDTSFVNSVYFQVLGGVALGDDLDIYTNYGDTLNNTIPLKSGYALAGTVGVVLWEGLSVEADVLHTSRVADDEEGITYATTSLMANLKYTADLNETFSIYGAAGLGMIRLDERGYNTYTGPGYQLILGASAQLTDNIAGLVEYRYQAGLSPLPQDGNDYFELNAPVGAVLAGLKLSF